MDTSRAASARGFHIRNFPPVTPNVSPPWRLRHLADSALRRLPPFKVPRSKLQVDKRERKGKSLELRASVSLARLWRQQGKQHEAYALLSTIYNWFTEGFETKDLQEAKALLEALA